MIEMLIFILIFMLFLMFVFVLMCILETLKIDYMEIKHNILVNAIYLYYKNEIANYRFSEFELYKKIDFETAFKKAPFWYWGYKNFLSDEDLEKVKPFIPQAKKEWRKK